MADPEIVALICPRPLQVQMGRMDELVPADNARRQAERAHEYYRRLGQADRFEFLVCEGGHEFFGEPAWRFLGEHL